MGHITTGGLVSEVRGSVGSLTYSRNAYGPYVKAKLNQTIRNTSKQLRIRNIMSDGVAAWQAMTDEQRRAYSIAAKDIPVRSSLGRLNILSGYNLFLKMYITRRTFGFLTPPLSFEKPVPPILSSAVYETGGASSRILLSWRPGHPTTYLAIYYAKAVDLSTNVMNPSLFKYVGLGNSGGGLNLVLTGSYDSVFGVPYPSNEEKRMFVGIRFIVRNSGLTTPMTVFKFITNQSGSIYP